MPERRLPAELARDTIQLTSQAGPPVEVARCSIQLTKWSAPVTVDTYGGKAIVDVGTQTYAELAVLQQVFLVVEWELAPPRATA